MKSTLSMILSIFAFLATTSAAVSTDTTYNLRVDSTNPAIKGALLAVKDESATTSPNDWVSGLPASLDLHTISLFVRAPQIRRCSS